MMGASAGVGAMMAALARVHLMQGLAAVPDGILRQMGAYAALLAQVYPGRRVETAILWTRTGALMWLSPDIVRAALQSTAIP